MIKTKALSLETLLCNWPDMRTRNYFDNLLSSNLPEVLPPSSEAWEIRPKFWKKDNFERKTLKTFHITKTNKKLHLNLIFAKQPIRIVLTQMRLNCYLRISLIDVVQIEININKCLIFHFYLRSFKIKNKWQWAKL